VKSIIATIGTRGDEQPYLALATGLQRAGHEGTLASHPVMRSAELDSYQLSRGAA
jgi:sterol 3beta-glucosyltransferase